MKNKARFIIVVSLIIILLTMSTFDTIRYYNNKNKLIDTEKQLITVQNELTTIQATLQEEIDKNTEMCANIENISNDLNVANATIADLKSEEYELVYLGDFKITHYCNELYKHICGNGDGLTAIGTKVTVGRTIAVDPKVIPYGTQVYIEGYGWRIAEDCGGAVNKKHIDIAVNTHSEAMSLGVTNGGVWMLVKKS